MTDGGIIPIPADASWRRENIGGWLCFPAFGLVMGCLSVAVLVFVGTWAVSIPSDMWRAPTVSSGGDAIPRAQHDKHQAELNKARLTIAACDVLEAVLLAFLVRASVRFFRKKRNAPAAVIATLVAQVVVHGLILALLLVAFGGDELNMERLLTIFAGNVLAAAVWIPYFRVSKRVKRTFVVA
jgi:hypothetical protein